MACFMQGRHGNDDLNLFLSAVILILLVLSMFLRGTPGRILWYVTLILLIYMYFRFFSRNLSKRYAENQKFLELKKKLTGRGTSFAADAAARKAFREKNKDFRIFVCPDCSQKIRIPRGKGKIMVHCPKCGKEFKKRT